MVVIVSVATNAWNAYIPGQDIGKFHQDKAWLPPENFIAAAWRKAPAKEAALTTMWMQRYKRGD